MKPLSTQALEMDSSKSEDGSCMGAPEDGCSADMRMMAPNPAADFSQLSFNSPNARKATMTSQLDRVSAARQADGAAGILKEGFRRGHILQKDTENEKKKTKLSTYAIRTKSTGTLAAIMC